MRLDRTIGDIERTFSGKFTVAKSGRAHKHRLPDLDYPKIAFVQFRAHSRSGDIAVWREDFGIGKDCPQSTADAFDVGVGGKTHQEIRRFVWWRAHIGSRLVQGREDMSVVVNARMPLVTTV